MTKNDQNPEYDRYKSQHIWLNEEKREMKTLDEIKTEWAKDHSYENYFEFLDLTRKCDTDHIFIMDGAVSRIAKRFAKEVAKEALKNASEKSQLMMYYIDEEDTTNVDILNFKHRRIQSCYAVPKQSILNESNIPSL